MEALAALDVPGGYGKAGQQLTLQVDVTARVSDMTDVLAHGARSMSPQRRPVTLPEIATVPDALTEELNTLPCPGSC